MTPRSFPKAAALSFLFGGICLSGMLAPRALAQDRIGSDAPHQERNGAATAPIRRAVPVTATTAAVDARKAASNKTSATTKKKKGGVQSTVVSISDNKVTDVSASQSHKISDSDLPVIGSGAPHQERNSDPNAHAGRLVIFDR